MRLPLSLFCGEYKLEWYSENLSEHARVCQDGEASRKSLHYIMNHFPCCRSDSLLSFSITNESRSDPGHGGQKKGRIFFFSSFSLIFFLCAAQHNIYYCYESCAAEFTGFWIFFSFWLRTWLRSGEIFMLWFCLFLIYFPCREFIYDFSLTSCFKWETPKPKFSRHNWFRDEQQMSRDSLTHRDGKKSNEMLSLVFCESRLRGGKLLWVFVW